MSIFSTCEHPVPSVAAVELADRLALHCVSGSSPILRCSYYTFSYIIFSTMRTNNLCPPPSKHLPEPAGSLALRHVTAQEHARALLSWKLRYRPPLLLSSPFLSDLMIHLVNNLLKYDAIFSTCENSFASFAAVELDDRLALHCLPGSSPILRCSYYTFSYIIFSNAWKRNLTVLCCSVQPAVVR